MPHAQFAMRGRYQNKCDVAPLYRIQPGSLFFRPLNTRTHFISDTSATSSGVDRCASVTNAFNFARSVIKFVDKGPTALPTRIQSCRIETRSSMRFC